MVTAWAEIAERHGNAVFRAAREMAPDDDAAWDCVQDAFVTALRRAPGGLEDPVRWLCGVARNHARNLTRSRRRWRGLLARLRPGPTASPGAATGGGAEDLSAALSRLPAKQREAVVLRYLGEMTIPEVAVAQGVSESAAKARIHRGLARLRKSLGAAPLLLLLVREAAAGGRRARELVRAARAGAPTGFTVGWAPVIGAGVVLVAVVAGSGALPLGELRGTEPARPSEVHSAGALGGTDPAGEPGRPRAGGAAGEPARPGVDGPAAAPAGAGRLVLRDLADGRPLARFRVKFVRETRTSGPDGAVEIPKGATKVTSDVEGWRVLGETVKPLIHGGDLWLCRNISVRGRVAIPEGSDLTITDVEVGSCLVTDFSAARVPRVSVRPRPDGSFELDLPAIRGLAVYARAERWMPVWREVPLPDESGDAAEGIVLAFSKRAIRLHGTIRGREGVPLRDLTLHAAVTKRMKPEEFRRRFFRIPGHALTATVSAETATANFITGCRTGPRGRLGPGQFEIWIYTEGEILLTAYPPGGYAPIDHRIRRKAGESGRVRIPVEWVGPGAVLTLLENGAPVRECTATLLDFSLGGPQYRFSIPVGPGGRMPTALLVPGHRYKIDVRSAVRPIHYLEWEPVKTLDLSDLPVDPKRWWKTK